MYIPAIQTPGLAAAALFCLVPSSGPGVEPSYPEGRVLTFERESSVSITMERVTIFQDGEEVGGGEPGEQVQVQTDYLQITDRVLAAEDGMPSRVERTFDRIERTEETPKGSEDESGPLDGFTITLSLDEEDGVQAEVEDGEDVDGEYLTGFSLTYDEDCLLPEEEASEGDSWELEGEALQIFLGHVQDPSLFEGDGGELDDLMAEAGEHSVEVTFAGMEEVDGMDCAVFTYVRRTELEADDVDPAIIGMGEGQGPEGAQVNLKVELDVEGRLLYAVEGGHPVLLESIGEGSLMHEIIAEQEGIEIRMRFELAIEGSEENTWSAPGDDEEDE